MTSLQLRRYVDFLGTLFPTVSFPLSLDILKEEKKLKWILSAEGYYR
jgi:hypothetical protein